jgi:hypothetical protein
MNRKKKGEIGERIAIGELAKFGIDVMLPMSDNLPFDLVVYYNNRFFKCQVKTSSVVTKEGSIAFDISTNDWYKHSVHKYTKDEVDVWILCDLKEIYLLRYDETYCSKAIKLRSTKPLNNQQKNVRYMKDYVISEDRINKVFK